MATGTTTDSPANRVVELLGFGLGRAHAHIGAWLDKMPGFTDGSICAAYELDPNFEE